MLLLYTCLKGGCSKVGFSLSFQVTAIEQEVMSLHCTRGASGCILGKTFLRKSSKTLKQAAQGRVGVTISRGVQKMCMYATEDSV